MMFLVKWLSVPSVSAFSPISSTSPMLMTTNNQSPITLESSTGLIDPQAQLIVNFLREMGLPHDNIIAELSERAIIGKNLAGYLESLPAEVKKDARYLSKFVVGAGFGLFDYSLNSIWNEVVIDLHKKAIAYGLDIFYDAAIGGKARDFYKTEQDLRSLKDAVLLDTVRKLELIADTTYKKLKHILDMRNDVGISHPTNYTINAFELLGWLQTCIQDVLRDHPTEAALQVQAFIQNLKSHPDPIDGARKVGIEAKIQALPSVHCGNILRTMFGIYVSPDVDPQVRKNVAALAPTVWNSSAEEPRFKLGLILEGYNTNLYREKYSLGEQFFQVVGGNSYRSNSERAIIVDTLVDKLLEAHNGWDNFHHEPPLADELASFIAGQQDILPNFSEKLIKVILMCRIGRGVDYKDGVSPRGKAYYDRILSLLGDRFAVQSFIGLMSHEIQAKMTNSICREQSIQALSTIKGGVVNGRLIECIDYLISNLQSAGPRCLFDANFKRLTTGHITWT